MPDFNKPQSRPAGSKRSFFVNLDI